MFLWVHLVLTTIIDQESVQDLRRAVDRLPAGLPGVYERPPEFVYLVLIHADTRTFLPDFDHTETNISD
jgi:hypothetical protein